ncbi:DeoR/GlpR transcriptional regulator [Mycobacterium hackensackense]|uniref:DeoR/GlpR family DNA-binding transcription regulator n=1 Tax=Mycobacterium hackensackense TaxID=228909 RepID=UPI002265F3EB|nr:DeoR/GlpR family DNA-binding transcription regulator [Mycobacterium hackensackense]MCV7255392.1 DeoR/GlpR transcriptional regulator [Mycobacterium hackensackense]
MDSESRQRMILEFTLTRGRVEVSALAEELDVALETVRRDLKTLANRRQLKRVHGGAIPLEIVAFHPGVEYRRGVDLAHKHRIAAAAVELLRGATTVFLDAGYTSRLIAERLVNKELTVITPSLLAAEAFVVSSTATVLLLGGRIRGSALSTADHWTLEMLRSFNIDLAYLEAKSISIEHGITTCDPADAAVKQSAVRATRRRILIAADSMLESESLTRFAEVSEFEAMVTGPELSNTDANLYETAGTVVIRA